MARTKDHWLAIWRSVGLSLGDNGYSVHMGLQLPREPGRIVDTYMTPQRAEELAADLRFYAEQVRTLNKKRPQKEGTDGSSAQNEPGG